jgi:primosomal protein N''
MINSISAFFLLQKVDQLISKANCQAVNSSSKKRTNEFVFTSMRRVFAPFLEEIEDSKKAFQNYLTSSECLVAIYFCGS